MKKLITVLSLTLASQTAIAAQECSTDFAKTAPNTRYTYSDNGTVTDLKTGLTWMRCPVGMTWNVGNQECQGTRSTMSWQLALSTAKQIRNKDGNHPLHNFADKKNWRLANIKELVSLTERACHSPAINSTGFASGYSLKDGDDVLGRYVWSNTPNGDGKHVATFDTTNGEVFNRDPLNSSFKSSLLLVTDE
ncbi:DUF1566 domain-containing protein [Vibrio alginolyticus]|uniref:Lcl C-terminal domain-containing protein n=1 Tax=Vibrio alginolyticus TaxID=663 RepID=UPI0006CA89A3|nr:DUF1566 domain-containing protein [Vibrio alginolyticus]MDF5496148.1 DUF1566 domain-containing protein [Vibrio parahaemolyticus]EGR2556006.1 DUF1566 domain-containing protein [Vibrio alginolyticus]EJV5740771.1 DUF1566 domain-containing protein [Vibrio alginolyticus]EKD1482417.1 DUF1566 domain-containing protein [Vibrio alginolyticus]KPM92505.1 HutR like protein [Vibrio alginolyticus]